jgi:hypothetical protein
MVALAAIAARIATIPVLGTIAETDRPANSAAKAGRRLPWPSAQRNSIATLRPS